MSTCYPIGCFKTPRIQFSTAWVCGFTMFYRGVFKWHVSGFADTQFGFWERFLKCDYKIWLRLRNQNELGRILSSYLPARQKLKYMVINAFSQGLMYIDIPIMAMEFLRMELDQPPNNGHSSILSIFPISQLFPTDGA